MINGPRFQRRKRDYVTWLRVLSWLIGGDLYSLIIEKNIQETLKFEEGEL